MQQPDVAFLAPVPTRTVFQSPQSPQPPTTALAPPTRTGLSSDEVQQLFESGRVVRVDLRTTRIYDVWLSSKDVLPDEACGGAEAAEEKQESNEVESEDEVDRPVCSPRVAEAKVSSGRGDDVKETKEIDIPALTEDMLAKHLSGSSIELKCPLSGERVRIAASHEH